MGNIPSSGLSGQWCKKWLPMVHEALSCLDRSTLTWRFLPTAGGYYDQDEFLMSVWELIRQSYIKAMSDPEIVNVVNKNKDKSYQDFTKKLGSLKGKGYARR